MLNLLAVQPMVDMVRTPIAFSTIINTRSSLNPPLTTFRRSISIVLKSFGIDPLDHDIRFVEDDWESPTLGAWGLGWEVWLDGMEITQFTYFQQAGGIELNPIPVEITYGIERIAMYLQGVDNVFDLEWTKGVKYGDIHHRGEVEFSKYNFEEADVEMLFRLFEMYEKEAKRHGRKRADPSRL